MLSAHQVLMTCGIGLPPSRDELAARVGHDPDAMGLLFEWSMAEYVERYITDERLQCALLGQGIIGTNASPFTPGTASIHFHHSCGRMFGRPGMWGYVKGGMGRVSFILADIARDAGVEIRTGMPVARINPAAGVELAGRGRREGIVRWRPIPARSPRFDDGRNQNQPFRVDCRSASHF